MHLLLHARSASRVQRDFAHLLERMRQRLYPESMQVLAYYWLRTLRAERYQAVEWKTLDRLLQQAEGDECGLAAPAIQSIVELRQWVQQVRQTNHQPSARSSDLVAATREVSSEALVPYLFRLLNEWLPIEVARLLVDEPAEEPEDSGIPVLVVARAIERLLLREHLSYSTLEAMLFPGPLSPRHFYPADAEVLQDVVLFLLGRTEAPAPAKLPAALLCVAPDAPLSLAYAEAVGGAVLTVASSGSEELQVSIPRSQAAELLKADHLRITSTVVTMDGQLWQADKLQSGEQDSIVYLPAGRLRIDYSEDHARIVLPWPETHAQWSGPVSFAGRLVMFGREWHISYWEQNAQGTLLHLVFVASLPITALTPDAETRLSRSHPAEIDMAWTALERALASAWARRNLEPLEQLRRAELVPLGRALFGLCESLLTQHARSIDAIETRLKGVRYLIAGSAYGPVPWRILPAAMRKILSADRIYWPLADLFHETFEGLPEVGGDRAALDRWSSGSLRWLRVLRPGSNSPSRAA
jgi:hypothetical protein